jgi:hypothetical protein
MNPRKNVQSSRALSRALLTASAAAIVLLSQSSCGGLGLGKRDKDKGDDAIANIDDDAPKKKRGSLFERSKRRNSYINDDIQTTRRDRYAAQSATTFTPSSPATLDEGDFTPSLNSGNPVPGINTPLAPRSDLNLDPEPDVSSLRTPQPEAGLRLPSLDSDFPQADQLGAAPDPYLDNDPGRTANRRVEDEGYIPLQPKLPGAESIQPPSD